MSDQAHNSTTLEAVQLDLEGPGVSSFARLSEGLPGLADSLRDLGEDMKVAKIDDGRVVVYRMREPHPITLRQAVLDLATLIPLAGDDYVAKRLTALLGEEEAPAPAMLEEVGVFLRIPDELAKVFPDKSDRDSSPPHVTMLYVGKVTPDEHAKVVEAVKSVLAGMQPLRIQLTDYGEFKNDAGETIPHLIPRSMGPVTLEEVQRQLQAEVEKTLGRQTDQFPGPWKAHATLAYVKAGETYQDRPEGGEFDLRGLEVWGETGGRYGRVEVSLGGEVSHHEWAAKTAKSWHTEIKKRALPMVIMKRQDGADEERTVFGVVLVPETVDSQGDIYSEEEIRKTMYRFMERYQRFGLQHRTIRPDILPLECYQAPMDIPEEVFGQPIKKGTWLLRVRIQSDAIWRDVKSGKITGFSIGGSAIRRPEARQAA